MNRHINYQVLKQDGQPTFAVVPYQEFIALIHDKTKTEEKTIPHAVVESMIENDYSPIKAWRLYLNMTQQDIADKIGITRPAFAQIEHATTPKPQTLKKVSIALGIDVSQIDV